MYISKPLKNTSKIVHKGKQYISKAACIQLLNVWKKTNKCKRRGNSKDKSKKWWNINS